MTDTTTKGTIFGREPVLFIALINAALALAIGFGLNISTEQLALTSALVNAVLAFVAREQVTPNNVVQLTTKQAQQLVDAGYRTVPPNAA